MGFPNCLVLATHNAGKIAELRRLFASLPVTLQTALDLDLEVVDEHAGSYRGNARLKAAAACRATGWAALADDTGIEIDALRGAPGVETADFAARHGGWPQALDAIARLTGLQHASTPLHAVSVCALALARPGRAVVDVEVRIEGHLAWPPTSGPGFAAVFRTFPDEAPFLGDGVLLHRRRAFEALAEALD